MFVCGVAVRGYGARVRLRGVHTDAFLFDTTVSDSGAPVPLADTPSPATAASFGVAAVSFGLAFEFAFRVKRVVKRVGGESGGESW